MKSVPFWCPQYSNSVLLSLLRPLPAVYCQTVPARVPPSSLITVVVPGDYPKISSSTSSTLLPDKLPDRVPR